MLLSPLSTPIIATPTAGVKGKGFKSRPLSPNEEDIADGVKSKVIGVTTLDTPIFFLSKKYIES